MAISGPPSQTGAWIFVSHSHADLAEVRKIRDELERLGHQPLLFFLKALEDNDARLPQLIREEIEARTWFVLCDSEAARLSKWVNEEREIVEKLAGRKGFYIELDLRVPVEPQFDKLARLSKRATVFISYASPDAVIAERIYDRLKREEYRVFFDRESVSIGGRWIDETQSAIAEAINLGFVLLLISPAYLRSAHVAAERSYAFEVLGSRTPSNIISVLIDKSPAVAALMPEELRGIQYFDLTKEPIETGIDVLIHMLKRRPMA